MVTSRVSLLLVALIVPVFALPIGAHTTAHLGDITDPANDGDLRTAGLTPVPASLDVVSGYIDATSASNLVFHVGLRNLNDQTDPASAAWRYYLFWYKGGSIVCPPGEGDLAVLAVVSPAGPGAVAAVDHPWWVGCFSRTPVAPGYMTDTWPTDSGNTPPNGAKALVAGTWRTGPGGNEVTVTLPRAIGGVPVGTQIRNLQIATWSFSSPIGQVLQRSLPPPPTGTLFYGPLPFADVTTTVVGPFTV